MINALAEQCVGTRSAHAVALCVSPAHQDTVLLGGAVEERVVIDETFATRDLVADVNRTATYRVLTISDATVRSFAGDRQRLSEERSDEWPLQRSDDMNDSVWSQTVTTAAKRLGDDRSVPTVTAGVRRSVHKTLDASSA